MPRQPRIEYEGALYHEMSRGNAGLLWKGGGGKGTLVRRKKNAADKQVIAWLLRKNTTVSLEWIAQRLAMGHYRSVTIPFSHDAMIWNNTKMK